MRSNKITLNPNERNITKIGFNQEFCTEGRTDIPLPMTLINAYAWMTDFRILYQYYYISTIFIYYYIYSNTYTNTCRYWYRYSNYFHSNLNNLIFQIFENRVLRTDSYLNIKKIASSNLLEFAKFVRLRFLTVFEFDSRKFSAFETIAHSIFPRKPKLL